METSCPSWVHSIASHPDYAEKLGIITAEWSALEWSLCSLFAAMLGVDEDRAEAVFFTLTNNRSRREVVASLAKVLFAEGADLRNRTDRILRRTRNAASRRNSLAHGIWTFGEGPESGSSLALHRETGILTSVPVEPKSLDQVISQLRNLREDMYYLTREIKDFLSSSASRAP
jgi:hypothetical protein